MCSDASQTVCAPRFVRDTGFVVPGPARFAGISLHLFVSIASAIAASEQAPRLSHGGQDDTPRWRPFLLALRSVLGAGRNRSDRSRTREGMRRYLRDSAPRSFGVTPALSRYQWLSSGISVHHPSIVGGSEERTRAKMLSLRRARLPPAVMQWDSRSMSVSTRLSCRVRSLARPSRDWNRVITRSPRAVVQARRLQLSHHVETPSSIVVWSSSSEPPLHRRSEGKTRHPRCRPISRWDLVGVARGHPRRIVDPTRGVVPNGTRSTNR